MLGCFCRCSVWYTWCGFLPWELTMQKSDVAFRSWAHYMSCFFQPFDRLLGFKQLKLSRIFWTCSWCSSTFIGSKFSQAQKFLSVLKEILEDLGFAWIFSVWGKSTRLGLSRLSNLFLPSDEFVCANKFSWIVALEARHSLKTIRFSLSGRRSCIYCNHCFLSCGESFLVVDPSPPDFRPDVYPSWLSVYHICKYFCKFDDARRISCWTGGQVCNFMNWALTKTSDQPYFYRVYPKHESMIVSWISLLILLLDLWDWSSGIASFLYRWFVFV